MEPKIILDLCGGTGAWSKPYQDAGYDVRIITLPGQDVCTYIPPKNVHGILAAPPCDQFSKLQNQAKHPPDFKGGLQVVDACLRVIWRCKQDRQLKWWALENPAGFLYRWLGQPKARFQPWQYGDPWKKNTCLWGEFTPPGKWFPVPPKGGLVQDLTNNMPNNAKRRELRATTPPGFAKAFYEANP